MKIILLKTYLQWSKCIHIKYGRTVGFIKKNEHEGIVEIVEQIGVIAGVILSLIRLLSHYLKVD